MSGKFLEDHIYLNISPVCYTTTQEPLVPFHINTPTMWHPDLWIPDTEDLRQNLAVPPVLNTQSHRHPDNVTLDPDLWIPEMEGSPMELGCSFRHTNSQTHTLLMSHLMLCKLHTLLTGESCFTVRRPIVVNLL